MLKFTFITMSSHVWTHIHNILVMCLFYYIQFCNLLKSPKYSTLFSCYIVLVQRTLGCYFFSTLAIQFCCSVVPGVETFLFYFIISCVQVHFIPDYGIILYSTLFCDKIWLDFIILFFSNYVICLLYAL